MHIPFAGKTVAVERDLYVQAAQQEAIFKALDPVVPDVQNGIQTRVVEFITEPVVKRQRATQHLRATHHVQKTGPQMAHHPPVEAVFCRRIGGQRRFAQITHRKRRFAYLFAAVQQRTLQCTARQLTIGPGDAQRYSLPSQQPVSLPLLSTENKPGVVHTGNAPLHAGMVIALRCVAAHHPAPVTEAGKRHVTRITGSPGAGHAVDGINLRVSILKPFRSQQIFAFQSADGQRVSFQGEKVNHRYAMQTQGAVRHRQITLPHLAEHHFDVKMGDTRRERHIFQPVEVHEHKLLAEGKILQQQLPAAERAVAFRPQTVLFSESTRRKITVQLYTVILSRQPDVQRHQALRQPQVQGAACYGIFSQINRQPRQVCLLPVCLTATGKADAQD